MNLVVLSSGYPPNTVYLVWEIPHDNITSYQVFRNEYIIADSLNEEQSSMFEQPTRFDRDHHSNLFKKSSTKRLMYIDTDGVGHYKEFSYHIVAYGLSNEVIKSNAVYATTM